MAPAWTMLPTLWVEEEDVAATLALLDLELVETDLVLVMVALLALSLELRLEEMEEALPAAAEEAELKPLRTELTRDEAAEPVGVTVAAWLARAVREEI